MFQQGRNGKAFANAFVHLSEHPHMDKQGPFDTVEAKRDWLTGRSRSI